MNAYVVVRESGLPGVDSVAITVIVLAETKSEALEAAAADFRGDPDGLERIRISAGPYDYISA